MDKIGIKNYISAVDMTSPYVKSAINTFLDIQSAITSIHVSLLNKSEEEIESTYYNEHLDEPSPENPLAFFEKVVDEGSVSALSKLSWYQEALDYNEGQDSECLRDAYRRRYFEAKDLINKKLSKLLSPKQRRSYINNLVSKITYIHKNSTFLFGYEDYLRPYQALLRYLHALGFSFKTDIDYKLKKNEKDYKQLLEDYDFVKSLISVNYLNLKCETKFLFRDGMEEDYRPERINDYRNLFSGKINSISNKKIDITGEKNAFYYLIKKLSPYSDITLSTHLKANAHKKLLFNGDNFTFDIGSFDNVSSRVNPSIQTAIDSLFK